MLEGATAVENTAFTHVTLAHLCVKVVENLS